MYGVDFNFKYPFVYLLTALIAGILCRERLTIPVYYFYGVLGLLGLYSLISFSIFRDLLLLAVTFFLGIYLTPQQTFTYSPAQTYKISCCCEESLTSNNYILSIGHQRFYLNGPDPDQTYRPRDSLHFYAIFYNLRHSSNPGGPNFNQYLKQKHVISRIIPVSEIVLKGHSHHILFIFNDLRQHLLDKTAILIRDTTYRTLINALCLGAKNDLEDDIRQLFVQTGTIHLLSVSGLHTGAIFLMLLFLFKRLRLSGNKKQLLLLPILWAYACLTGLSPSVVRAATILSFITISKVICRTYIPLNTIAASAFLTLLINPALIYSLSFQLSYCAYTGILVLYPFLYHLFKFPPILSKIYACCCISIAAQLPTLPISAYYFHTINLNGFLANILAIPMATLLLYSGVICLFLPVLIGKYLIFIPQITAKCLLGFLRYFEPYSYNIQDLYPSLIQILSIYLCFCSFSIFLFLRKSIWLQRTIRILLVCHLVFICSNIYLSKHQEIILFHFYGHSAILLNYQGFYALLKTDLQDLTPISPYIRHNKLCSLPPSSGFQNSSLQWNAPYLYTAKDTIYIAGYAPDRYVSILIVTTNIMPEQFFPPTTRHFPRKILSDGSLSPYYTHQWEKFCQQRHISFQSTHTQGYIRLPLK